MHGVIDKEYCVMFSILEVYLGNSSSAEGMLFFLLGYVSASDFNNTS